MGGVSGLSGISSVPGIFGCSYYDKVLWYEPIAFWPLNELSGSVAHDWSGNGLHGSITGCTLGQSGPGGLGAFYFDGVNDYVGAGASVLSALNGGLFNGDEGTLAVWARAYDATVWTDDAERAIGRLFVDDNNYIMLHRNVASNRPTWIHRRGGTYEVGDKTTSTTAWFYTATTWSASGDIVQYRWNGAQMNANDTGLGTWAGDLTKVYFGSSDGLSFYWKGWISCIVLFDYAMTTAQMDDLYVIS